MASGLFGCSAVEGGVVAAADLPFINHQIGGHMKYLQNLIRHLPKAAQDHSPAILTALGATGVVTTAYVTHKATWEASQRTAAEDRARVDVGQRIMTRREILEENWQLYIPVALIGSVSIASIILSHRVSTRRTAAMAAGLAITERAYDEYREKAVETFGKNKEQKMRSELQQDRVTRDGDVASQVIITDGNVPCKDAWSGRYWPSTMEKIKQAQNNTNYEVLNQGYASLSDFYSRIGLEPNKESDNVGWNSDKLLEVSFTTAINDKQEPVLVMDFGVAPLRNFFRGHA